MHISQLLLSVCAPLAAAALSISQINGPRYLSPYAGQAVTDVQGLVTAKGPAGFFLRSTGRDIDPRPSSSIYVFGSGALRNVTVGDVVSLDATVTEYRSSDAYVYLTELTAPKNIRVLSAGNKVEPVVIGSALLKWPPTEQYSALDHLDVFGVPNNQSLVSAANPTLWPLLFGMDFWESLTGELVTVKKPTALSKPNNFGDTWVVGSWRTSGANSRGGLTITDRDANPEAILIGSPLDGSRNPRTIKLGDSLEEITGVVTQAFGFYRILPTTTINATSSRTPALPPATNLVSSDECSKLTFGSYNVENLTPTSAVLPSIAGHIVNYLKTPPLVFVQEIQDNSGATNNGVVSSNITLTRLIDSIAVQSGVRYAFAVIDPVDGKEGGQPGGNIRVAYLYNPLVVRLRKPNQGISTAATAVLPGPALSLNPGRIDPANAAWTASRVPLAAAWETVDGRNPFFTVNVHFGSKGGSSSIQGDARPPVNGGVADRLAQMTVVADFVSQILAQDAGAHVVVAGDFNEFTFVQPMEVFKQRSKLVDLDEAAGVDKQERYTYLFDMNCQELDHMFISGAIARKRPEFDHIHVNTWATFAGQISDHDPSVARLNVCQK